MKPGSVRARVLVYSPTGAPDYARGLDRLPGLEIRVAASPAEAVDLASWPDVFFGAGLGPDTLLKMPRLRWVQWLWAGVDTLMSSPSFARAVAGGDLRLSRAVGVFGRSMAEYVLTWCLCLAWDVPRGLEAQRVKLWQRFRPALIEGRRLGVAGLGDIGSEIARLAGLLGLSVTGLCRSGRSVAPVERVFRPQELVEFVSELDYFVLALPLTTETRGMISAPVLAAMKPTAALINVGRGALIDEEALITALRAGRPGRAVLDVVSTEPLPASSELWTISNVFITPHIAGVSRPEDVVPLFGENLERYIGALPLLGEVSGENGY